jgi:hypothetical protein
MLDWVQQEVVLMEASSFPDSAAPDSALEIPDLHDRIRRRAEEIYFRNGQIPGRDLENWTQAELEIRREAERLNRRAAVVINVNGVQYIGEYRPETSHGYVPGEFGAGASVMVRLNGDKMLIKRPNGRDLETTIVQKIR